MNLIERLLDAAPAAIMAHDVDGFIVHVNHEWVNLFGRGRSSDEIVGTEIGEYYPRAALPELKKRSKEVFETGRPARDFDIAFSLLNGLHVFLMHDFPIRDEGQIVAVGTVATDITERRRQQARAAIQRERSDRLEAIGELAAGVAHDFNNLLGIIDMHVAFARKDHDNLHEFACDMEQIENAVKSGTDLVESLLTFSRRQPGKKEQLVVRTVAHEMAEMFRRTMNANIKIRTIHDQGAPWIVVADRTQLERTFINLVVNARDAMPDGGRLTVSINKEIKDGLRFVKVDISDTGEGMSEEVRKRVFEPFFTTKPKGKGSGLGLATVYGVVRSMGGMIDVESEVGSGTTFSLWLPAFDPQEIEALSASSPSHHASSTSSASTYRVRRP